jgi:cytoskeletal protein CcmA (bactofilin family)
VELGPTARVIGNVYYNLIEMAIGAEIKVGTVAAIEKTLKQRPDVFDKVRPLIDGTSSGTTLAPVDDARDAVQSTRPSTQDAFDTVDTSAIEL